MQSSESDSMHTSPAAVSDSGIQAPLIVSNALPAIRASPVPVSDRSTQVQLECWSDESTQAELQQLREEVRMLRVRCQRSSGVIAQMMMMMICRDIQFLGFGFNPDSNSQTKWTLY